MKTYAYALDLKPDGEMIGQYVEWHKHVPPEVLEAGYRQGILSQKIFLVGNRLFRIVEATDDYDPDSSEDYALQSPVAKEWDERMRAYQQPVNARKNSEWWARMELVFECSLQDIEKQRPI